MLFKRNKNQVGGIAYQHVNDEAPIETQEIDSNKTKSIIKQLRNGKEHVNAGMATNIKLDTAELAKSINELKEASGGTTEQPKIHELSKCEQSKGAYLNGAYLGYYYVYIDSPWTLALLRKPNTRLAIIEDDANA
jgi:hypothetical protein